MAVIPAKKKKSVDAVPGTEAWRAPSSLGPLSESGDATTDALFEALRAHRVGAPPSGALAMMSTPTAVQVAAAVAELTDAALDTGHAVWDQAYAAALAPRDRKRYEARFNEISTAEGVRGTWLMILAQVAGASEQGRARLAAVLAASSTTAIALRAVGEWAIGTSRWRPLPVAPPSQEALRALAARLDEPSAAPVADLAASAWLLLDDAEGATRALGAALRSPAGLRVQGVLRSVAGFPERVPPALVRDVIAWLAAPTMEWAFAVRALAKITLDDEERAMVLAIAERVVQLREVTPEWWLILDASPSARLARLAVWNLPHGGMGLTPPAFAARTALMTAHGDRSMAERLEAATRTLEKALGKRAAPVVAQLADVALAMRGRPPVELPPMPPPLEGPPPPELEDEAPLPSLDRQRADLARSFADAKLGEDAQRVLDIARPCVDIRTLKGAADDSVGANRLGGLPDLPPSVPWPRHRGQPLAFVAQFRLPALHALQEGLALPREGLLSFFVWDVFDGEKDDYLEVGQVLHLPDDALVRSALPADYTKPREGRAPFRGCAIELGAAIAVPPSSHPVLATLPLKARRSYGKRVFPLGAPRHRISGYAAPSDAGPDDGVVLLHLLSDPRCGFVFGDLERLFVALPFADAEAGRFEHARFSFGG